MPDADLHRAATVLGILAHSYYYVSAASPVTPPPSVAEPWRQVCCRLGRLTPVLSYIDLIVYNWRLIEPAATEPMRVGNMRLLVPTVDNEEEHIFYLTQTEILARSTPMVAAVARAQEAVIADDPEGIQRELLVIIGALRAIVRRSLPTVSPRPLSPTYVDPVVWAKTVAPFAVPLSPGVLGPTGTSSIFSLLDAFFRRPKRNSDLGREVLGHRAAYPPHWRYFLAAVEQVSVPDYVRRTGAPGLADLLHEALDLYAGPEGFLGRHRRKVFGYLEVAFKVGRNVTIGGFSGSMRDRTWEQVDRALETSRTERVYPDPDQDPAAVRVPGRSAVGADPASQAYDLFDLALHNDDEHGYWIGIDGSLYDITSLLRRHPGGPAALQAYAGRDASATYHRLHAASDVADRLRLGCRVGELRPPPGGRARQDYEQWSRLLDLVVEMQNALRLDYSLCRGVGALREPEIPQSLYLLERTIGTYERFLAEYLPLLTSCALDMARSFDSGRVRPHQLRARQHALAGDDNESSRALVDLQTCCARLKVDSLDFLNELKLALR